MSLPEIKLRVGDVYEMTNDHTQPLKLIGRGDCEVSGNGISTTKKAEFDINKITNIYAKEVWNAAIEKAAEEVRLNTTGNWVIELLEQIRRLKK